MAQKTNTPLRFENEEQKEKWKKAAKEKKVSLNQFILDAVEAALSAPPLTVSNNSLQASDQYGRLFPIPEGYRVYECPDCGSMFAADPDKFDFIILCHNCTEDIPVDSHVMMSLPYPNYKSPLQREMEALEASGGGKWLQEEKVTSHV